MKFTVRGMLPEVQEGKLTNCYYVQKECYSIGEIWNFPGGKVEKDETYFEALCREFKEECNIDIKSAIQLTSFNTEFEYEPWIVVVFYIIEWKGEPIQNESKIMDSAYVNIDDLRGEYSNKFLEDELFYISWFKSN